MLNFGVVSSDFPERTQDTVLAVSFVSLAQK